MEDRYGILLWRESGLWTAQAIKVDQSGQVQVLEQTTPTLRVSALSQAISVLDSILEDLQ